MKSALWCGVTLVVLSMTYGCARCENRAVDGVAPAMDHAVRFEALTAGPVATDRQSSGGVSVVDYDGDGDPDLFVTNGYNVSAEEPAAQPNRLVREVQTHSGWRSQSDLVQHFGLGSEDTVDVEVRWPSGHVDRLQGTPANQRISIVEGS